MMNYDISDINTYSDIYIYSYNMLYNFIFMYVEMRCL